jgi:hypothetical protein
VALIANGGTAHVAGVLLTDNVTPIAGRTVTITLGTGASAQTCNGTTDATGKAACTISPVTQPLRPVAVGDKYLRGRCILPSCVSEREYYSFCNSEPGEFHPRGIRAGGPAPATFKGFGDSLSAEPPNLRCRLDHPVETVQILRRVFRRTWACSCRHRSCNRERRCRARQTDRHREDRPWVLLGGSGTCGNRNEVAQFCH